MWYAKLCIQLTFWVDNFCKRVPFFKGVASNTTGVGGWPTLLAKGSLGIVCSTTCNLVDKTLSLNTPLKCFPNVSFRTVWVLVLPDSGVWRFSQLCRVTEPTTGSRERLWSWHRGNSWTVYLGLDDHNTVLNPGVWHPGMGVYRNQGCDPFTWGFISSYWDWSPSFTTNELKRQRQRDPLESVWTHHSNCLQKFFICSRIKKDVTQGGKMSR